MPDFSRGEIDRLGERLRAGEVEPADADLYFAFRGQFAEALAEVERTLTTTLGLPSASRLKRFQSVVAKLKRQPHLRLSRMQDFAGCRVVVAGLGQQDEVVARLEELFPGSRIVDRRERPSSGYRAVHVMVTPQPGILIEVQVRSQFQDLWAQLSERFSDRYGLEVKYGGGPDAVRESLRAMSDVVWVLDRGLQQTSAQPEEVRRLRATLLEALEHPDHRLGARLIDALERVSTAVREDRKLRAELGNAQQILEARADDLLRLLED